MLKFVKFSNFKSWPRIDLECAPITGIFGTNSSGKTSIIQFILLMKQTKDETDRALSLALNGDLIQLGSISDTIYNHNEAHEIDWNLQFKLPSQLFLNDPSKKGHEIISKGYDLSITAGIRVNNKAPVAHFLRYDLGGVGFSLKRRRSNDAQFELESDNQKDSAHFSFVRTKGRAWQLPGPIKSYAFPDQARTYFQNAGFLADLEAAYEKELNKIFYLGPLRDFPKRDYLWARSRPSDVGQRGEKTIDAILAATEAKEKRNIKSKARLRPFQEMIAYWLREMGLIENFRVDEIAPGSNRWQAKVTTRPGGPEVFLTDVGFGVSQVLPVITILQYVPEGSTVILEQPEIHLHPLAQAGLADVIIQAATHRNIQIILESHSEHLLLRLQRRIAEEALSQDYVRLYFCNASRDGSIISQLELDLLGNILNWPEKFMGDAFGEASKAELARLSRRKDKI